MEKMYPLLLTLLLCFSATALAQEAPDFSIVDLEGRRHQLYHALGQDHIVLLFFAFADCLPCNEALPEIRDIQEDYDNQNVLIWYVSDRDSNARLEQHLDDGNLKVIAAGVEGNGPEAMSSMTTNFSFFGYPTVAVICPDKQVTWDIWPYSSGAPEWRNPIEDCGTMFVDEEYIPIETPSSTIAPIAWGQDIWLFPSPITNGQGHLDFEMPQAGTIQAQLLTSDGRVLQELFRGYFPPGKHRQETTFRVPPGTYFIRLVNGQQIRYLSVVVL